MRVIRGNEIERYLESEPCEAGILADTAFLYALSDTDDRLYKSALDVYEPLENRGVAIFANVISRMEFVDLLFRKQITGGAIEIFKSLDPAVASKNIFNFFKSIRDEDTAHRNDGQSYKIPEGKLKKLREHLESEASSMDWKEFCQKYTGAKFHNDWSVYEQELGLNFVEVLEGQTSDIIASPLFWADMVQVMGEQGIRGPDAMIANLFLKSRFPLLITADKDIARAFDDESPEHESKTILYLEQ